MSALTSLETWAENFSSEEGNGNIISSFAGLGVDSVALCEDISLYLSGKATLNQLMVDAYKIARDASELVVDVQKSDTVLGKVMGRIFAFASVPGDVAETHTKKTALLRGFSDVE
jgi:hypothetical protein